MKVCITLYNDEKDPVEVLPNVFVKPGCSVNMFLNRGDEVSLERRPDGTLYLHINQDESDITKDAVFKVSKSMFSNF
jgi:hypothetical protein